MTSPNSLVETEETETTTSNLTFTGHVVCYRYRCDPAFTLATSYLLNVPPCPVHVTPLPHATALPTPFRASRRVASSLSLSFANARTTMSPLTACFCRPSSRHSKPAPDDDEWEDGLPARLSADSDGGGGTASPAAGRDKQARKNTHLFKDKRVLTRPAAKDKLKKIINVKKSSTGGGGLDSPDHEFLALAKIYSEVDASFDLTRAARNRDSLSHLLPFVMNALLYGFRDDDDSITAGRSGSASGAAYSKKHSALTGLFGSRSADTSQPRHLSLNGASHLVKAQCERQLETFIHQQAMRSVGFALECAWYLTTSLLAGPPSAYHHTMTLLLSMESVIANYAAPGDLFKKADLHGDRVEAPSAAVPTSPSRSAFPGSSANPVTELELPTGPSTAVTAPSPSSAGGGGEIVEEGDGLQLVLDTTGDGERDLTIAFPTIEGSDEAQLRQWLVARSERSTIFHAELDFIKCLTDISNGLFSIDREFRRDVLRRELEKLNSHIPKNVFLPTEKRAHRILRIVPEAAHVFSTKERVPYLMVVEVEDLGPPEDAPGTSDKKSMADKKSIGKGEEGKRRKGHTGSGPGPLASAEDIVAAGGEAVAAGGAGGVKGVQGDDAAPNMPEDKFEFLPEMTTTDSITGIDVADINADVVASEAGGAGGGGAVGAVSAGASPADLTKRISSFHVDDAEYDDDRRPPDEELIKALGEPWAVKTERMRKESPYGSNPNWRLISCIVKARDQLRQEMFAQRLIQEFSHIFIKAKLPLRLQPYNIIATSSEAGLIETLYDAKSIDSIKKDTPNVVTLQDYFIGRFGGRGSSGYKKAVKAFVQSMAGYAVVSYLLNIKDRHNGNLMICADGAIVHIDFGFCRFLRGGVLAFLSFWSTLSTALTFLLWVHRNFSAVQLPGWEHGVRACAF